MKSGPSGPLFFIFTEKQSNLMAKKKSQDRLKQKLTASIRQIFQKSGRKKLNYKQISSALKMKKPHERMLVGEILEQLKSDGLIREAERGKFIAIPKASVEIRGRIEMTRRGAGYVAHESFDKDIFIPAKSTRKALNGDEVLLEVNVNKDNKYDYPYVIC